MQNGYSADCYFLISQKILGEIPAAWSWENSFSKFNEFTKFTVPNDYSHDFSGVDGHVIFLKSRRYSDCL